MAPEVPLNSNISIPDGAQLIFMSYYLSTMNNEVFGSDEIWFVAKGNNQNCLITR